MNFIIKKLPEQTDAKGMTQPQKYEISTLNKVQDVDGNEFTMVDSTDLQTLEDLQAQLDSAQALVRSLTERINAINSLSESEVGVSLKI